MDKSVDDAGILDSIIKAYDLSKVDANIYSPLSLAFIGDSVYGLVVKSVVTLWANCPANTLNAKTTFYVKAVSQAKIIDMLIDANILSEDEYNIYRRGRNAKSSSTAKNASVGDYRKATGLEALIGYLYLEGNTKRLVEIIRQGMQMLDDSIRK